MCGHVLAGGPDGRVRGHRDCVALGGRVLGQGGRDRRQAGQRALDDPQTAVVRVMVVAVRRADRERTSTASQHRRDERNRQRQQRESLGPANPAPVLVIDQLALLVPLLLAGCRLAGRAIDRPRVPSSLPLLVVVAACDCPVRLNQPRSPRSPPLIARSRRPRRRALRVPGRATRSARASPQTCGRGRRRPAVGR